MGIDDPIVGMERSLTFARLDAELGVAETAGSHSEASEEVEGLEVWVDV